jgi:hypothetical protein
LAKALADSLQASNPDIFKPARGCEMAELPVDQAVQQMNILMGKLGGPQRQLVLSRLKDEWSQSP